MFKIISVEKYHAGQVKVYVRMDAKEWIKIKNNDGLGSLYGVDISNKVFREYGVKAYNPTVADRDRASGGIKWLTLYYTDPGWKPKSDPMPELPTENQANQTEPCEVIKVDFINKRRVA